MERSKRLDLMNSGKQKSIGVIVGSTRPQRICKGIAQWVLAVAREAGPLEYDLIDLADIALPFLDEPFMAALGRYEHEHTKRWSRLVESYDGFVFVMPQYNWGYTAVLKNALDFLYAEWHGKAASVVTYGSHGGGKGAEQLKAVLQALGLRCTATNPRLDTPPDTLDGERAFDAHAFAPYMPAVRAMHAELVELVEAGPRSEV
jgi:NAD(P)H-dependent FMN reductase